MLTRFKLLLTTNLNNSNVTKFSTEKLKKLEMGKTHWFFLLPIGSKGDMSLLTTLVYLLKVRKNDCNLTKFNFNLNGILIYEIGPVNLK